MKALAKKLVAKACYLMVAVGVSSCNAQAPAQSELGKLVFSDDFTSPESLEKYTTNNFDALPSISIKDGRYRAEVVDNSNDKTLHFNQSQGRLDAQKAQFPFVAIVRNIGIESVHEAQKSPEVNAETYIFAGLQVHVVNLDERDSSHVVVGHRGSTQNTIEAKNTIDGHSWVNDIGKNTAPNGRADIMIVGNKKKELEVFWQEPNLEPDNNKDHWKAYNGSGKIPGNTPNYGQEVYIGLITYAFKEKGLPFIGTADSFEIYSQEQ